jgi:hypothetical protein
MMVYQVQGMQPALYHRYGIVDDNEDDEDEDEEGGRLDNMAHSEAMALEASLVTEAMSGMDLTDREADAEAEAEAAEGEQRPEAGGEDAAEASTSAGAPRVGWRAGLARSGQLPQAGCGVGALPGRTPLGERGKNFFIRAATARAIFPLATCLACALEPCASSCAAGKALRPGRWRAPRRPAARRAAP